MASARTIAIIALALLAIVGGASARKDPEYDDSKEYYSPPPPKKYEHSEHKDYKDKEYYSPPPHKYEDKKDDDYYSSPPPPYKHDDDYEEEEYPEDDYKYCEEYAKECDFKFQNSGIPTFHLIAHGDNAYGPIIVDKYNYPTKVLNANGDCEIYEDYSKHYDHKYSKHDDHYSYDDDCKNFFYFQHNRVATRTFNNRPVKEFKGKCIRLDISSAQLWDHSNLNPYDGNKKYPEDRRCVVFRTA